MRCLRIFTLSNARKLKRKDLYLGQLKMSTFVSHFNPLTGKSEWKMEDENYDYQQEIARSSYADMLHDTERNQLYYKGLAKAIAKRRQQKLPVHVLDIGTGTGLLSMMAAKLGADTVHACEAFAPMAECAKKIIAKNGFAEKIHIIPKRSTEVTVGEDGDMPQRANILVTEVFDTELIGEGAISTFTHAHKELLEKDCFVVPPVGNMYAQLVSSEFVRRWTQVDDINIKCADPITCPEKVSRCGGAPSLHDLQLDQLARHTFKVLTEPLKVFRFDFSGKTALPFKNTSTLTTEMLNSGNVDAIFMWWNLEFDNEGEIILSCAPRWAHPTPENMQWRDHWMQAIYYPYTQPTVAKGDQVKVISKHDEYSLWFDVRHTKSEKDSETMRPVCDCGAHIAFSRSRLGMLSDPHRRDVFLRMLRKHINSDSVCLCISDGSLLPLMAARLGAKHVYTTETNPLCSRVIKDFINHNNLSDSITILEKRPEDITSQDIEHKVTSVLGEPVFQTSLLPWDNIYFWYAASELSNQITEKAVVLPCSMTIYGVAVEYSNLWKIRADVGICEGFDIGIFDDLIQETSDRVDLNVEPQPLWEYPCRAVSEPQLLLDVDFTSPVSETSDIQKKVELTIDRKEACNGLALWADFSFGEDLKISTGPVKEIVVGEKIDWDYYTRQGVHLIKHSKAANTHGDSNYIVTVSVDFKVKSGDLKFAFQASWIPRS